jgi:Zn-dependent protease with chaperone function
MPVLFLVASFCIAFLVAFSLNWLALIPWRRSVGQHWTERARLLYPAIASARLNNWLIPASVGLQTADWPHEINVMGTMISAFLGTMLAGFFLNREVRSSVRFKLWLRLVVTGLVLFFVNWLVLIFAIVYLPENFGPVTWLIAGGIFIFMLAFHFGLGLRLLRWFGVLQPATESLKALVAEVSGKMRVPVRATWILSTYVGNAAAFPQIRQLIFTDKLLETLSDEETKTVCAHELGHLSESRGVILVRALASFAFYPLVFTLPLASLAGSAFHSFCFLFTVSIILLALGIRVSRRMEKRADKIAAETQTDTAVYARALERLYASNLTPAVMPRRTTKVHPNLYDRMMAAGVTPDFPKPLPPQRQSWTSYLMCAGLFLIFLSFFSWRNTPATSEANYQHFSQPAPQFNLTKP